MIEEQPIENLIADLTQRVDAHKQSHHTLRALMKNAGIDDIKAGYMLALQSSNELSRGIEVWLPLLLEHIKYLQDTLDDAAMEAKVRDEYDD